MSYIYFFKELLLNYSSLRLPYPVVKTTCTLLAVNAKFTFLILLCTSWVTSEWVSMHRVFYTILACHTGIFPWW